MDRQKLAEDLSALTGDTLPEIEFEHLLSHVYDLLHPEESKKIVDWDLLPAAVRNDLREAHEGEYSGAAELEESCRADVAGMRPRDVLDAWLSYNGIIGYTWIILLAWNGIIGAMK